MTRPRHDGMPPQGPEFAEFLRRELHAAADQLEPRPDGLERIRARVGEHPIYVSIDIDVLDPAHAPGTGTPEPGGITSRELFMILRAMEGLAIVGADVVEVSPPYDHAELTGMAAANVVYELLGLLAKAAGRAPS